MPLYMPGTAGTSVRGGHQKWPELTASSCCSDFSSSGWSGAASSDTGGSSSASSSSSSCVTGAAESALKGEVIQFITRLVRPTVACLAEEKRPLQSTNHSACHDRTGGSVDQQKRAINKLSQSVLDSQLRQAKQF